MPPPANPPGPASATPAPALEPSPVYDWLRDNLKPLTDWLPPEYRALAPDWAWWLLYLIALLLVLLIVGLTLKRLGRVLARKPEKRDWDAGLRVDLEECPMPIQPDNELRPVGLSPAGAGTPGNRRCPGQRVGY